MNCFRSYEAANRMARQADHYRWRDAFEDGDQKLGQCREAGASTQKSRKLPSWPFWDAFGT
jgi:hypothetical protein